MILITGCGRSGTTYIADVMEWCGMDMPHEAVGVDGSVSSLYCVDSEWYPPYHVQDGRPPFETVLHQVRHPLKTIGSLTTSKPISWMFNAQHVDGLDVGQPIIEKCCRYWIGWNEMAEAQAKMTYQIEELQKIWPILAAILPFPTVITYEMATQTTPRDRNSRKHRTVGWSDLGEFEEPIRRLARRYGYKA